MTQAADSSQAGYLLPTQAPVYGTSLEDLFQRVVAGITGLPGNLVRPRYQLNPPTLPQADITWASLSVFVEPIRWNPYKTLQDDLHYTVEGQETLRVLVSFIGPEGQEYERRLRDGIHLAQNRDELVAAGIEFTEFAEAVNVPTIVKEQWTKRVDIRGTFQRWCVREYAVRSLLSADGTIRADRTPAGEVIGTFHTDPPPT